MATANSAAPSRRGRRKTREGTCLYYQETGRGTPIIFLHGLGFCGEDWQAQAQFFVKNFRVITPDFRGHGYSLKPDCDYSIATHVQDILQLMDHLKIEAAHLVGWSLGSVVGIQLAVDAPQRVLSLTAINPQPGVSSRQLLTPLLYQQRLMLLHTFGMKYYAHLVANLLFPYWSQIKLRQKVAERIASNSERSYCHALKPLFEWDITHRLEQIAAPTLIISGDRDYTSIKTKRDCICRMKNAELAVVKDSGHGTPLEQPDATNQVLQRFLAAH